MKNHPHQQPYDGTLKGLFSKQAALIIPYLFPMIRLEATPLETEDEAEEQTRVENKADKQTEAELNIEINRSTLKADLLYRAFYNLKNIILVIELQTKQDPDLQRRLMAYHGSLHLKYKKPVVLLVIYVFEDGPEDLFYQDMCEGEVLATIHPKVICLRDLDSEQIVHEHELPLYTLLPVTNRPEVHVLKQALQEMQEHYDEQDFNEHLIWFQSLMERTRTLSEEEKQIIEEVLKMQYQIDPIIRENRTVMAIAAEAEAKGEAKGRIEGEIKGKVEVLQEMILELARESLPILVVSQIQQAITSSQNVEQLKKFHRQLARVSDEQEVSALLTACFPPDSKTEPRSEYEYIQDLILDFVSARFSSQVVTQVQQAIAPIQDIQLLRKFNRQLVRVSDEQEVSVLLVQYFPTH